MFVQNVGFGLVEMRVSEDECRALADGLEALLLVNHPTYREQYEHLETVASLLTQAGAVAGYRERGADVLEE